MGKLFKAPHSCSLSIPSAFILLPEISDPIPEVGCGQSPQKAIIMMSYLSCKKIENDVYNFPTWQYCKYKDIFDSRIIINSTAKFYISISYQKDLLSIDTRIFTPSFARLGRLFLCLVIIFAECVSGTKAGDAEAHDCNEIHNTHWLSPPFHWILF